MHFHSCGLYGVQFAYLSKKWKQRPICDNNEQSGLKYQGKRGQAKTLKGSKSKG